LAAAREEAKDILDRYAKRHKDEIGLGEFYRLRLEAEARAGNLVEAADLARRDRQLMARRLAPYLAKLTAGEQLRFFRLQDDPALHSALRLGVRDPRLHAASAEWLLNGKAKIAEVMAQIYQSGKAGKDFQEFQQCSQRQAYLLHGPRRGDKVRLELLEVEKQKRDLAAARAVMLQQRWYTVEEVRKSLAPDEAFLDVFAVRLPGGRQVYYAWVVTADAAPRVVKLGDAATINKFVADFQAHLQSCIAPDVGLFDTIGPVAAEEALRRDCLGPLSLRILPRLWEVAGGKTRWAVSPDGPLWNLPWGALVLPRSGKYAAEEITFRYVISGRSLAERRPVAAGLGEPWILGNPAFDRPPGGAKGWVRSVAPELEPLQFSGPEGREVAASLAAMFRTKPAVQDIRTTKEGLLKAHRPRVVYLATHGFSPLPVRGLPVDDPLLSCGVAFAGWDFAPDGKVNREKSLPGLLTGAEVLGIDLQGTELVVLSACKTGTASTPQYGQSPADLRHAFHLAGARAVVSSLWSVDDKSTRELLVAFMRGWAGPAKMDKASALTAAQRELIDRMRKDPKLMQAHPIFWALFTLSGS
jgi:hypothetical protein